MPLDDQLTREGKSRARYLRAQLLKVEVQLDPLLDRVRDLRMRRRRIENSLNDLYEGDEYRANSPEERGVLLVAQIANEWDRETDRDQ